MTRALHDDEAQCYPSFFVAFSQYPDLCLSGLCFHNGDFNRQIVIDACNHGVTMLWLNGLINDKRACWYFLKSQRY